MRKVLLFLVISLCLRGWVNAQEVLWREITLEELGWGKDVVLEGSNPSYSFYFPDFPGVNWEASTLYLKVKTSPLLNTVSTLSLYGDNNLLFSTLLTPGEQTLRIPLSALSPSEKFHRLEVRPSLSISNNLCEDLASGHLFLSIKKESSLALVFEKIRFSTLREFLAFPQNRIEIVLPAEQWSQELQRAYIELYAFLHRFYRNLPMEVETVLSPLPQTLAKDCRRIFLAEKRERDFELYGWNLYVTPQGVRAMIHNQELFSFSSAVIQSTANAPNQLQRRLSFAQLGINELSFKGIGTFAETIYFASADLGGIPQMLTLTLYSNTIVPRDDSHYGASLKVKLNGVLVWTEKISPARYSSLSPKVIALPPSLLRRENALEIAFTYLPEIGNCRRGEAPFEATISSDSYLEARGDGYRPPFLSWNDVPTFFWGKGFIALPETPSLEELMIGAQIAASLRVMDQTPIDFTVISHVEAQKKLRQLPPYQSFRNFPLPILQRLLTLPKRAIEYTHSLPHYYTGTIDQIAALSAFLFENYLTILKDVVLLPFTPFMETEYEPFPFYFLVIAPQEGFLSTPLVPQKGTLVVQNLEDRREIMRLAPYEPLGLLATFWENKHPVILFTPYGKRDIAYSRFLKNFHREKHSYFRNLQRSFKTK